MVKTFREHLTKRIYGYFNIRGRLEHYICEGQEIWRSKLWVDSGKLMTENTDIAQGQLQKLRFFLPGLSPVTHVVPVLSFHLPSEASGGDTEQGKKPWQHAQLICYDLQDHLGNYADHHFLGKTPVHQTKDF